MSDADYWRGYADACERWAEASAKACDFTGRSVALSARDVALRFQREIQAREEGRRALQEDTDRAPADLGTTDA